MLHLLGIDVGWILDYRDGPGVLPVSASIDPDADVPALEGVEGVELDYLQSTGGGEKPIPKSTTSHSATTSNSIPTLTSIPTGSPRVDSSKLHQPIYKLCLLYSAWVGGGWLAFRVVTGGEVESMERWRGLIVLVVLGALGGALIPWRGVGERERMALRR